MCSKWKFNISSEFVAGIKLDFYTPALPVSHAVSLVQKNILLPFGIRSPIFYFAIPNSGGLPVLYIVNQICRIYR